MPVLSFEEGKKASPIAHVKGGINDGKVLYIHEEEPKDAKRIKSEIPAIKYLKDPAVKDLKPHDRTKLFQRLEEASRKDVAPEHLVGETEAVRKLYERIIKDCEAGTTVALHDDAHFEILPSPDPKKRDVFQIAGASGSGKSQIALGIANYYKKLFPDREVYLVSKLDEDPTIDKCKPKRINVQTLVDDYPKIEEFEDCLIIFDDIDCFEGKQLKAVHQLIDDLAITGRHTNTSMMFLTHFITNYKKTRLILNEATHYVVYPLSTSYHALGYLLKTHVGMTPEEVKELRKLGRWVCIRKNFPQQLLSAHTAKVLHAE